jgi:cyanobactin cluster PatC/TenC/TruC protein
MARSKRENGTEKEPPVPSAVTDAQALHALLAAYFAALAALKAPPPVLGMAGLSAFVYWSEYFANPDHLQPQDTPFVRGRIWS